MTRVSDSGRARERRSEARMAFWRQEGGRKKKKEAGEKKGEEEEEKEKEKEKEEKEEEKEEEKRSTIFCAFKIRIEKVIFFLATLHQFFQKLQSFLLILCNLQSQKERGGAY